MSTRFASALVVLFLVGCEKPAPLSPQETETLLIDAPELISGSPNVGFAELDGFYLKQSNDEAEARLKSVCGKPLVYEGGYRRENAVFKGCLTPKHPDLHSFRIGFHPKIDNAVFTLEIKRRSVPLEQIRARFYSELETPFEDLPRPGILRMRSAGYNLFASSDKGADGPVHIVLGLNPDTL